MRAVRGNEISMIFQEPMTSLNPVLTIGRQIAESLELHRGLSRREALAARDRDAAARQHARARAARHAVSAPALRRHAPARDDRDGARVRPAAADRRRADDRARRHDTGADPRSHARAQGQDRRRDRADHARPRRRRRDGAARRRHVRRAARSRKRRSRSCSRSRAIPTRWDCSNSIPRLGDATGGGASALAEIPGMVPSLREETAGCIFAPRCAYATERCRVEYPPLERRPPAHFVGVLGVGSRLPRSMRSQPSSRDPRCDALLRGARTSPSTFPVRKGVFSRVSAPGARGRRRELLDRRRRNARSRRRERLRQVDDRQGDPAS